MSGTTDKPVVVTPGFASGGTADSNDYGAWTSPTTTIAAGSRDGTVTLPITNDSNYEDTENFTIEFFS